jgi:hypothetical protein
MRGTRPFAFMLVSLPARRRLNGTQSRTWDTVINRRVAAQAWGSKSPKLRLSMAASGPLAASVGEEWGTACCSLLAEETSGSTTRVANS